PAQGVRAAQERSRGGRERRDGHLEVGEPDIGRGHQLTNRREGLLERDDAPGQQSISRSDNLHWCPAHQLVTASRTSRMKNILSNLSGQAPPWPRQSAVS